MTTITAVLLAGIVVAGTLVPACLFLWWMWRVCVALTALNHAADRLAASGVRLAYAHLVAWLHAHI